jgi:hypothetical protein
MEVETYFVEFKINFILCTQKHVLEHTHDTNYLLSYVVHDAGYSFKSL